MSLFCWLQLRLTSDNHQRNVFIFVLSSSVLLFLLLACCLHSPLNIYECCVWVNVVLSVIIISECFFSLSLACFILEHKKRYLCHVIYLQGGLGYIQIGEQHIYICILLFFTIRDLSRTIFSFMCSGTQRMELMHGIDAATQTKGTQRTFFSVLFFFFCSLFFDVRSGLISLLLFFGRDAEVKHSFLARPKKIVHEK